ncbi:hypothetical protein CWT12_12355 [Actinomyces sp. 432]|uniref:hypothetical protein n=1 Tax=Actinomyces sp. 432 TaxID=2057798 RepID=UPI001373F434|nr:hypothetical protein [Actinomyces sp. 432]QHO91944.1 hypothetical protein CWT12_12355 [Actinomyces sp. 432]
MTTTSTGDLAAAINSTRDALLRALETLIEACDTLNQAIGHIAYAQELATDQAADDDTPGLVDAHCHRMVTTRDIPAIHVHPGMRVVSHGNAHLVADVESTECLVRIHLDDAPDDRGGLYLCAPDDDVTITDDTAVLIPDKILTPLTGAVRAYRDAIRRKGYDSALATTRRSDILEAAHQLTNTLDDLTSQEDQ